METRLIMAQEDYPPVDFHQIRRLPPYVFEPIKKRAALLKARGEDVIDLSMGNPDLPLPDHIAEKLMETVRKPRTNRYSTSRGIPGLRRALANYYGRRFGVKLDPDREVIATLGSKEGFANLAQAISAPGDVILSPNPSYPIHAYGFIMAGATIRHVRALSAHEYLAGLERAVRYSTPAPIAMVLCYPANPTAETVGLDFYKDAVRFAKKHGLWILSDIAYSEIYFDAPPPSVLEVDGAKDVAVEVNTLSKTYSMAGLRVGCAVGNERLVTALARVKSYLDYGAYTPIQVAATAALNGPQDSVVNNRAIYRARRNVLVEHFSRAGWTIPSPNASMFAWAPIPEAWRERGSMEFAQNLLEHAQIAVSPGVGFGEYGEGFVRIALVENEARIRQAARNLRKFLGSDLGSADRTG